MRTCTMSISCNKNKYDSYDIRSLSSMDQYYNINVVLLEDKEKAVRLSFRHHGRNSFFY